MSGPGRQGSIRTATRRPGSLSSRAGYARIRNRPNPGQTLLSAASWVRMGGLVQQGATVQFYLMGSIDDSIAAALVRHGHKAHRPGEDSSGAVPPPADDSPA